MLVRRDLTLISELEAFWDLRRGGRTMPSRRDFIAEEFRPWFGHVRMLAVELESLRFKVTLEGTAIRDLAGEDFTGRYLDDAYKAAHREILLGPYRECVRTRRPRLDTLLPGMALQNFTVLERLMLPCGEDERVTHLIVALYAHGFRRSGGSIYAE
ncbi:PAS domain-containing protein [Azospirillum sp.]|uniref:PAS domain-containing protein n=1 Tax=Azospirillum sp. TaxID=34012 RepID=UPI003D7580DF